MSGLVHEPSCTGLLRVCWDHETSTTDPSGTLICRNNTLGRKTVRIHPSDWGGSLLTALVLQILMMEQLQIPVEIAQEQGTYTNYYLHDGTITFSPMPYDWDGMLRGNADPDCRGYPSFLAVDPANTSSRCHLLMLELWQSQESFLRQYVLEGLVEEMGNLGVLGRIGWYAPSYVLDAHPALATFRGLTSPETASTFRRPLSFGEYCQLNSTADAACDAFVAEYVVDGQLSANAPRGVWDSHYVPRLVDAAVASRLRALSPPQDMPSPFFRGAFDTQWSEDGKTAIGHLNSVACSWTRFDNEIIYQEGLHLKQQVYSSAGIRNIHHAAVANNESILMYWWEPHGLMKAYLTEGKGYELTRVGLGQVTPQCLANRPNTSTRCRGDVDGRGGGCDYEIEIVSKGAARALSTHSPTGYAFIKLFSMSNDDHELMEARVDYDGLTFRQSACEWANKNSHAWEPWLSGLTAPQCPTSLGLACGGVARGTCVHAEFPYPQGMCVCNHGFQGKACGTATLRCPAGLVRGSDGSCVKCPAGTYEIGGLVCEPVDATKFGNLYGGIDKSGLTSCPRNTRVLALSVENGQFGLVESTGAVSVDDCVCEPGYYSPSGRVGEACIECPSGAQCVGGAFPPFASPGFAQRSRVSPSNSSLASTLFFSCRNSQYCTSASSPACDCVGGSVAVNPSFRIANGATIAWADLHAAMLYVPYNCSSAYSPSSALCSQCSEGYAVQLGVCTRCALDQYLYIFAALFFVFSWFPLLRHVITKVAPSMYTTGAFIQYMGLYGLLDIPWGTTMSELLRGLSFFNLDLEAVHLTCSSVADTFEKMWLLQVIFVPLLYPCLCLIHHCWARLYKFLCERRLLGTSWLMRIGIMPQSDFQPFALAKRYGMPGLYFWNMYFYKGVTASFEMLTCASDGTGQQYLIRDPSTTCWTGNHPAYAAVAYTTLMIHLVGLPSVFAWLLFAWVPRNGYQSPRSAAICGFLYRRFQPELWYWEILELGRRIAYAVLMGMNGIVDVFAQSSFILFSVLATYCAELSFHPFRCGLYGWLEELTSLLEMCVIFFGIILIAYPSEEIKGNLANALAVACLIVGLLAVSFVFFLDVVYNSTKQLRYVRKAKGVMLPESIFDVRIANCFWINMCKYGDAEMLSALLQLEGTLLQLEMCGELATSAASNRFKEMLKVEPYLFDMLTKDGDDGGRTWGGLMDFIEHMQENSIVREHGFIPLGYLFTDGSVGPILLWLTSAATEEERMVIRRAIEQVQRFQQYLAQRETIWSRINAKLVNLTLMRDQQTRHSEAVKLQYRAIEEQIVTRSQRPSISGSLRRLSSKLDTIRIDSLDGVARMSAIRESRSSAAERDSTRQTNTRESRSSSGECGDAPPPIRASRSSSAESVGGLDSRQSQSRKLKHREAKVMRRLKQKCTRSVRAGDTLSEKVLSSLTAKLSCVSATFIPTATSTHEHTTRRSSTVSKGELDSSLVPIKGECASIEDEDVQRCMHASSVIGVGTLLAALCVPVIDSKNRLHGVIKCEGKFFQGRIGLKFTMGDSRIVQVAATLIAGGDAETQVGRSAARLSIRNSVQMGLVAAPLVEDGEDVRV